MKVLLSWIRDFVDVPGTGEEIGGLMSLRGLPLEGLEPIDGLPSPPWSRHEGPDAVLDFEVTANRPDCLSIRGIAREIATAYRVPLNSRPAPRSNADRTSDAGVASEITVTIDDPDLCGRYVAGMADVHVAASPEWMQARLAACGVRPINNIVDITNYVLIELGHPMHAFDLRRLHGSAIVVRRARSDERLTTLDGKERVLTADMLVIADAERASAIGGVMGGAESEVAADTATIVLESAWFKPQSVRSTSKRLALRTEASYRFERGADLTAPPEAMRRALELIELTGAGRARGPLIDCHPRPHEPRELTLDAPAIKNLLGMDVPHAEVTRILRSLGFEVQTLGSWQASQPDAALPVGQIGQVWRVRVPPWRVDIQRKVDLIEEVGRHYGFEHLAATFPAVEQAPPPTDSRIGRDNRVRQTLLATGFSEAITFGFVEHSVAAPYANGAAVVKLANPLSEKFAVLRPSLLPGLVDAVSHNRRHGRRDVRLFEIGTRFAAAGETRGAAVAWTGLAAPDHWSGGQREVDFFDVKGVIEQICAALDADASFVPTTREYLVAGRAAEVHARSSVIGVLGQLNPSIAESRELPMSDAVYVAELDLELLSPATSTALRRAEPLPRFPLIVRDVSILVDDTLSAETVRGTIRAAAPPTLVDLREFDRYQGRGIPDGKVSLALRLTFRAADRTLTDAEVHAGMDAIVAALRNNLGAIQR